MKVREEKTLGKEKTGTSARDKAIRMMQMSGEVVGSVAIDGIEDTTYIRQGTDSVGTNIEENALSSKDKVLTTLEKYEHVKGATDYLAAKNKNKKEAKKRIKTTRRETKESLKESSLAKREKNGEELTASEKEKLSKAKQRMKRYNKAVKKEERHIAKGKTQSDYEKIQAKKRKKLEHLSELQQATNYGSGDGYGIGVEENIQENISGTATWAAKRTADAIKDINFELGSRLEHGKSSKKDERKPPKNQKKKNPSGKHEEKASKRSTSKFEDKKLSKEEKHRIQKKNLQKRRAKTLFKNDKLSGTAARLKGITKSKGVMAAILGIAGPVLAIVGIIVILLLILASMGGVSGGMHEYTSYQAEDETLLLSNKVFVDEEKADKKAIKNAETDHTTASDGGGFDEYQYVLDGEDSTQDALIAVIKHDGNLIASYLTAKYFNYTLTPAIKNEIKEIYEEAFELSQYETIESRTATDYDEETDTTYYWNGDSWQTEECTYRYAIFTTELTTTPLDDILRAHLATEEQIRFYELYKSTSGQKDYLFGGFSARDDIYRYEYDPEEYKAIYGEADISFSDAEAQQIYNVAQTQLGRAYKWGGSSVASGFDCSGYVYWVMNTSGVASFPRTSANVILETFCDKVSPGAAKPGDLIFFQGTYATYGASHVGIYLGNNQMIHCGDPIKITNITTNYWTSHFYTFGRIKDEYR